MVTLPIPQLSLPEQVAWQAQFIVNHLRQTDYQFIEKIDMDRGVYDCDCNGFVGFVLQLCAYHHYKMIPKEPNQPRPRAFKYYEFFVSPTLPSTGGWQRIVSLAEARRGDILAWRFPKVDIEEKKNTGHVVFLAETPALIDPGTFAVRVYDSAAGPHFDDTRGNGPGRFKSGVGSGLINFKVNDSGSPTAFQFAPLEKFKTHPIAIGRLEPLP